MSVIRTSTAVVLAAVLGLSACGGGSSSPKADASPTPSTNGIEKLEATAILDKATAAAKASSGAHVSGTISDSGDVISLDMRYVAGKGAVGTLTNHGQSVKVLRIGTAAYLKGDTAFWTDAANAEVAKIVANKYVKVPSTSKDFAGFTEFTDLSSLISSLKADGVITKVPGKKVSGLATVGLKDDDPETGGVLYIANTGRPYPLLIEPVKPSTPNEHVTFDEWDKPTALTEPPAAEVIDIAKLGG